jgi:diguanylate cyclase
MSFPASLRWLDVLAGRDPALRRYALMMLATGQFYALTIGVMCHASYMALLDWQITHWISTAMVGCFLLFYTLVRSGWTQRFADPLLTFPLAVVTQLLVVAAYVLVGAPRADVVILLSQTLVVSMFRLTPKQTLLLGAFSVVTLSVAQLGLWLNHAPGFGNTLALAHFLVCTTALGIMTLVTKWVSDIRVRIHKQAESLQEALNQANVLATTDMLTGLMSRRSMMDELQAAVTQATAAHRPLSVALIDIDKFKQINDEHGHQCGDAVLKSFSAMAMVGMRDSDKLCRWGGEEFLLLLPDVDASQAGVAVDRLRQRIKELSAHAKEHPAITVSAGVAQWHLSEPIAAWLERADTAMYQAKSQGRDRCVADAPAVSLRPVRMLGLVK